MSNPSDDDPDLDAEEQERDLFALQLEEKAVVDSVIAGLRTLIARPALSPSQLRYLSFALLALERLPRTTPGVELDVTLSYRCENEMNYVGFYIGSSSFRLQSGGSVYDPAVGSDNFSSTVLEVEPDGFRASDDWGALSGWSESFLAHCRDRDWNPSFDWMGDESEVEWDDERDDSYWDRLKGEIDE